jgi:hypothetical protein
LHKSPPFLTLPRFTPHLHSDQSREAAPFHGKEETYATNLNSLPFRRRLTPFLGTCSNNDGKEYDGEKLLVEQRKSMVDSPSPPDFYT